MLSLSLKRDKATATNSVSAFETLNVVTFERSMHQMCRHAIFILKIALIIITSLEIEDEISQIILNSENFHEFL